MFALQKVYYLMTHNNKESTISHKKKKDNVVKSLSFQTISFVCFCVVNYIKDRKKRHMMTLWQMMVNL